VVTENESMHNQQPSAPKPRRFRRKLTPFLCQEMLYDYVVGGLDEDRRADVEAFLPTDPTTQRALDDIEAGLEYVDQLADTRVSEDLIIKLQSAESLLSMVRKYLDWEEWSDGVRWSATAVATSVLIAGLVSVIPWEQLPRFKQKKAETSVVLADIPKTSKTLVAAAPAHGTETDAGNNPTAASEADSGDAFVETSGDEHEVDAPASDAVTAPAGASKVATAAPVPPAVSARVQGRDAARLERVPTPAPASVPADESSVSKQANAAATTTAGSAANATANEPVADDEKKPKGFVFRAFMNVPDVEEITPELVTQLQGLGSEKAGEVPLGWRRGSGSYFHFTLPESNQEKAIEMLRAHGPVRISKDPHPRVMPRGQIRFILWVEPSESGNE
jgi:hypothetical protein